MSVPTTSADSARAESTTPPLLIDEDLLAQVGLAGADPKTVQEFTDLMIQELERRVGAALSEGCSTEQLDVFEAFCDRDVATTRAWIEANCPDYEQSPIYRRMAADTGIQAGDPQEDALVCEFATYAWLTTYRPDYPQVVAHHVHQLRAETIAIMTTHR